LLEVAQEDINADFQLPSDEGNFLDIGCGPGLYLSSLSKLPKYSNYKFSGIDLSPEMISYAKLSYRNISWYQRDVYETGFESDFFNIAHASFLFIHLVTPEIALGEINRILKKGGILYVVDVNDSTFQGPCLITRLIQKHSQFYEGDRNILNILPELASRNSFRLIDKKHITVNNQGSEEKPERIGNLLKLGRVTMWAMFSFINQRQDIQEFYQKAEKYYFNKNCEISIQIQTQIFEKI
jgi:ubiquinone/menaquinone biosynthesis C-methylase UbiE